MKMRGIHTSVNDIRRRVFTAAVKQNKKKSPHEGVLSSDYRKYLEKLNEI